MMAGRSIGPSSYPETASQPLITFSGGIDEQELLPHGTSEMVREEVAVAKNYSQGGFHMFTP